MTNKDIEYFFNIASVVASRSKDPSTKTGAVIVSKTRQIIACGYNGFPSGFPDNPELYNNKELKYPRIVHAEMNAILSAAKHGISTQDASIFVVPIQVCNECAKAIIQAGIKHVYCKVFKDTDTWRESFKVSQELFDACGVEVKLYFEQQ